MFAATWYSNHSELFARAEPDDEYNPTPEPFDPSLFDRDRDEDPEEEEEYYNDLP